MAEPSRRPKRATAAPVIDSIDSFERLLRQAATGQRFVLKLYVSGTSPRSAQAIANIRALCDERLSGRYSLEVVDIYQQPGVAAGEQIIAAPTLVRELPEPVRRLVGDLSNRDRVLVALNLRPDEPVPEGPPTTWASV